MAAHDRTTTTVSTPAAATQRATGSLKGFRFAVQPVVVASILPGQPGGGYGAYFRLNKRLPLNRHGRPAVDVRVNNTVSYDKLAVLQDGVPKGRACYLQGDGFSARAHSQTGQTVLVTIYALAAGGQRTGSLRMRGVITREVVPTTSTSGVPPVGPPPDQRVGCGRP